MTSHCGPYRIVDEPTEQKFLLYFGDYTIGEFPYGPSARDVVEPHAMRVAQRMNEGTHFAAERCEAAEVDRDVAWADIAVLRVKLKAAAEEAERMRKAAQRAYFRLDALGADSILTASVAQELLAALAPAPAASWVCPCGYMMTGGVCRKCGEPAPAKADGGGA